MTGCTQKKVELPHPITIEFYSVKTCSECIAFKKNAIPYLKKRYKNISINASLSPPRLPTTMP